MFSLSVEKNVSLAPYTTFKIGGPADYFFTAKSKEDLQKIVSEANANNIEYFILGNGSNILVSDQGFRGLIIKLELSKIKINNQTVTAEAGTKISDLLSKCKESSLSGLEFLAGVPATVGGIIWANAGSRKENISRLVFQVKILDENNGVKTLSKEQCSFKYRDSIFKYKNYIILEADFKLESKSKEEIEAKMKTCLENKLNAQHLKDPNIGSIFKNPEGKKRAWELIEEAGLKGHKIGGAKVSEKHANFIINTGRATASDVIMLISLIKQKVRDNLGVQLMEEIEYIGL